MFLHKRLDIPPSFQKKNGALQREHFSKHPLFTLISLFLTMSELCYISHEY